MEQSADFKASQLKPHSKLKIWNAHATWEQAEAEWNRGSFEASAKVSLKTLKTLPEIPGITPETARFLKWKSFKYMLFHPEGKKILKHFFRHPFRYAFSYVKALLKKKSYMRKDDLFFYGISSEKDFLKAAKAKNSLVVIGFSYCQKPHECPSGRFTSECLHDAENPVCRQCAIGKVQHALPESVIPLIIPTIHYIGDKIFELKHANPKKKILFLITACELTLEMFGDWGHMAAIRGIGVRLDGRICNTMRAFELSEQGIKPGLTVLREETQDKILEIIRKLREYVSA